MGWGLLEDREDEEKDDDDDAAADDDDDSDDDDLKVLFPLHATVYGTFLLTRT